MPRMNKGRLRTVTTFKGLAKGPHRGRGGPERSPTAIAGDGPVDVPARQIDREAAFTAAVRAGRSDMAATIARADVPDDATDAERERWTRRRRLYR